MPWLWRRPAATAPIQPLAWELPAAHAALKRQKKKKKKKKKNKKDHDPNVKGKTIKLLENNIGENLDRLSVEMTYLFILAAPAAYKSS